MRIAPNAKCQRVLVVAVCLVHISKMFLLAQPFRCEVNPEWILSCFYNISSLPTVVRLILCVVCLCDVGVSWLNAQMDRIAFWCEVYHGGHLLCIRWGSVSDHIKGDLLGGGVSGCFRLSIRHGRPCQQLRSSCPNMRMRPG